MAQITQISPFAPAKFPALPTVAGVEISVVYAALRYKPGRHDTLLVRLAAGTTLAGVFTRSRTASAAVLRSREAMFASGGQARALVVAAGNSVAGTGQHGDTACREIMAATARLVGCEPAEVQFGATGVIGEPFPTERLVAALPDCQPGDWEDAARTIATTDTFPKGAVRTATIGGVRVTLVGIVKGSGMVAPNMATMLGYIFTDARLPHAVLQPCLAEASDKSFNCITVDSDTSTSDTILAFAAGAAGNPAIAAADDPALADFRAALDALCLDLAHQVVKDGEGAQKFITVCVTGAASDADARTLGMAIANSPLVKTAIAGGDANWGRIVMALGKAGPVIDPDNLRVAFGGIAICARSQRVDGYDEAPVAAHLAGREIGIDVDVGVGSGAATVYTCDLTHGYIAINADYRS